VSLITFKINYNNNKWYKRYKMRYEIKNTYIRVTENINNIIGNIKFEVSTIKATFKGFRIRR